MFVHISIYSLRCATQDVYCENTETNRTSMTIPRSLVVLDQVHKVYAGERQHVTALRGVSLQIAAGDFVALMGPSGCGKSSLLHLIGGMDTPTRGRVVVGGVSLESLDTDALARFRRTQVGFVFQFFNLLPTLTVAENVALPLLLDGIGQDEAHPQVVTMLECVGLQERATHFPAELSGGEMQRVAVARALVHHPELIIADEPTGSLDSENGTRIMQLLTQLNREIGVTIVLATHADETARYAKQIVRLRDGLIENARPDADL